MPPVFIVGVVSVLKTCLLGTVRPEVPVETAVGDLPMFIHSSPPLVVPCATHLLLLVIAHQFKIGLRVGL